MPLLGAPSRLSGTAFQRAELGMQLCITQSDTPATGPRSSKDARPLSGLDDPAYDRAHSVLFLSSAPGKEICYQPFGCFSNEKPWTGILQRPISLFPSSPKEINTRLLLYTNENPNNYQVRACHDALGVPRGIYTGILTCHLMNKFIVWELGSWSSTIKERSET